MMNQRDTTYAKWIGIAGAVFLMFAAVLDYWPTSNPLQWVSLDEARGLAAGQNKAIFVDVYAEWCGPCKEMDKSVFPDDSVKGVLSRRYILAKINGDDPVLGDTLRKQFGIRAYPTYIVLSSTGRERKRHVGMMPKSTFIKWISDSVGVPILLWPDLQKAFQNAELQKRKVMVLVLQSGEEIERANAMFEEGNTVAAVDKYLVPTLLVRGNVGEEKLLSQVGASPKTGSSEIIILGDNRKEVGRFFISFQMQFNSMALSNKLLELAAKQTQ
jgi:thiol-disulfide isomerase/thioredoxin